MQITNNKETKFRWNLFRLETKNEAILVGFFNRKTKGSFKQWSTFFFESWKLLKWQPTNRGCTNSYFWNVTFKYFFYSLFFRAFFVLIGKIFASKSCQKTFWRKNEYLQKNNPVYGTKIRKFFPSAHPL